MSLLLGELRGSKEHFATPEPRVEDVYISTTLKEYFRAKTFREISPMLIEKFKADRLKGIRRIQL